jgi:RimJ/RimL family protein N-acetyltransferase
MLQPLLRGEKVRLTAFRSEDMETITGWYQDETFIRLLQSSPAMPLTEHEWKKFYEELPSLKNEFHFAVRPLEGDELLGWIGLDGVIWNHRTASVVIGFGEAKNREQGFGYDALSLLLRFAFEELNLHRVYLSVFEYNQRAIRLYEKIGFMREGTQREALLRNGRRYDAYNYAMLEREWRSRQQGQKKISEA